MTLALLDTEVAHDRWMETWGNVFAQASRPAGLLTVADLMNDFAAFDAADGEVAALRRQATLLTWEQFGHRLDTLKRLLHEHLCKELVFRIDREKAKRAIGDGKHGTQFGPEVAAIASDDVKDEIGEALWAWAFDRNTACVFHLMRVVEAGLIALTKIARTPVRGPRPMWSDYLKAIDRLLHPPQPMRGCTAPKMRKLGNAEREFLTDVHLHIRNIADLWRNPLVHEIAKSYTADEATRILDDIERLMVRIASHPKARSI